MGTGSLYDLDQRLPEDKISGEGQHVLGLGPEGHPEVDHETSRQPMSERGMQHEEDMTFMAHMHRHLGGPALMTALDCVDHHVYHDLRSLWSSTNS